MVTGTTTAHTFPLRLETQEKMAQSEQVKDKYFDNDNVTIYHNHELNYGYFAYFEHFQYFDNIDLSGIANRVKLSLVKHIEFWKHIGFNQFI